MKQKTVLVPLLALVIGLAVGTFIHRRPAPQGVPTQTERMYAMNVWYSQWPGWAPAQSILKQIAAATPSLHTSLGGPPSGDASKQIEEVEQLLEKGVNGIVLVACDKEALTTTVNKAYSNGIPVVTMFGDAENSKRLTFVTADDRRSGQKMAARILTAAKARGFSGARPAKMLLITSKLGIKSSDERAFGIKDVLDSEPSIRIVDFVFDNNNDARATEVINAAWEKNQGLDIIAGVVPRTAIGAVSALRERGKQPGDIILTGWDNDEDVLQGIKDGWIMAVSTPNISCMTQIAVSVLEARNRGYLFPDALRLQELNLPALPPQIDIQQTLIDKSNVDAYFRKK